MAFYGLERLLNLYDGYCRSFQVSGRSLLLIQEEGQRYLLLNQCPHQQASLSNATINDGFIRCSRHGIRFNLLTGRAEGGCTNQLQCFTVTYEGSVLGVDL